VQQGYARRAVLLIEVSDDLGVGIRTEPVSSLDEVGA
jgi:hypothetical protein